MFKVGQEVLVVGANNIKSKVDIGRTVKVVASDMVDSTLRYLCDNGRYHGWYNESALVGIKDAEGSSLADQIVALQQKLDNIKNAVGGVQ